MIFQEAGQSVKEKKKNQHNHKQWVHSFKHKSATLLAFETGALNSYMSERYLVQFPPSLSANPKVQFAQKWLAIKESGYLLVYFTCIVGQIKYKD